MNRILFAAARGARIQAYEPYDNTWRRTYGVYVDGDDTEQRIHPDDEHLQYGPISTRFRENAEPAAEALEHLGLVGCAYAMYYRLYEDTTYYMQDELHRSLFLLFVAEALADEGL